MTDAHDLSRLNDAERAILSLLAEGHTAKSIAAETGRSVGAVNERLREARRKTGVGSSRELARLLRAAEERPKNRDELVGIDGAAPDAPPTSRAPSLARWQAKVLLMTILVSVLIAAVALSTTKPQKEISAEDALFAAASADLGLSPATVRKTMAQQARDPAWADRTEALLRARYAAVSGVEAASLRISCRSTWCEALGRSAPGRSTAELKAAAGVLGSPAFRDGPAGTHLHADVTGTTETEADAVGVYRFTLMAYWRRVD